MPPKVTKKTKKDPNAPKRGLSAYMIFSAENRKVVQEQNPKATFGEMGKLLGQAWKDLEESKKKVFQEKAAKDKVKADKAMEEYKAKKPKDDARVPDSE